MFVTSATNGIARMSFSYAILVITMCATMIVTASTFYLKKTKNGRAKNVQREIKDTP